MRASEAGSIEIAGDSESADCLRRARTPSAQGFTRASDPFRGLRGTGGEDSVSVGVRVVGLVICDL